MTAVEWLKKELEDYGSNSHLSLDWNTFDELCEQAKEMEKQDIITAYAFGHNDGCRYMTNEKQEFEHGEAYYNETFNK